MDSETEKWKQKAEIYKEMWIDQQQKTEAYRKVVDDLTWLLNDKSRKENK